MNTIHSFFGKTMGLTDYLAGFGLVVLAVVIFMVGMNIKENFNETIGYIVAFMSIVVFLAGWYFVKVKRHR